MKNTVTLKSSNEFQHILRKGTWFAGDFMSLYVIPNKLNLNMLGVAVSKKFSKSSVKRNRVRRLIKEAYRLSEDVICKGYSLVILFKNSIPYNIINYDNIYKDLSKCLKKADILYNKEDDDA